MTVRVVLEFSDESYAKDYVADWLGRSSKVQVIAVFKKPTLYCDPADGHRNRKKTHQGWTRGKKYGWWVCSLCGKPTEKWATGDLWPFSLGFNLLPKSVSKWARPGWDTATQWTEEDLGITNASAAEEVPAEPVVGEVGGESSTV